MLRNQHVTKKPLFVSILIWANGFLAIFGVLSFCLYFSSLKPSALEVAGFEEDFDLPLAIAQLIGGGIHGIVAYGLQRAMRWSRTAQKVIAIPYLLVIPFGTAYALTAFIGLTRKEEDRYFSTQAIS